MCPRSVQRDDARLVRIEGSLSRVEAMLTWLCEALADEQDDEVQDPRATLSDDAQDSERRVQTL